MLPPASPGAGNKALYGLEKISGVFLRGGDFSGTVEVILFGRYLNGYLFVYSPVNSEMKMGEDALALSFSKIVGKMIPWRANVCVLVCQEIIFLTTFSATERRGTHGDTAVKGCWKASKAERKRP